MSEIEYRRDATLTAEQLADVFGRSGIKRPVDDLARIAKMVQNANLTWTAWDGDVLVGIARSLTDFSWCCYLSDLAVDRAYQERGIGRELVERTRQSVDGGGDCTLSLLSAPGAMAFYPKIGFEKIENGWMLRRTQ